jgi:hypothetical protein
VQLLVHNRYDKFGTFPFSELLSVLNRLCTLLVCHFMLPISKCVLCCLGSIYQSEQNVGSTLCQHSRLQAYWCYRFHDVRDAKSLKSKLAQYQRKKIPHIQPAALPHAASPDQRPATSAPTNINIAQEAHEMRAHRPADSQSREASAYPPVNINDIHQIKQMVRQAMADPTVQGAKRVYAVLYWV